jgi:hypothetical protein
MGEMKNAYMCLVGKLEGKRHLEDLGVYGRVILETGIESIDWILLV